MIEIQNISKRYNGVTAVDNISLSIPTGKIYGIIGRSGAGKSTLLRCVNVLETPTSGTVLIDGVDITALTDKALRVERQDIGMIFQHFNLLESRTVAQNIAFPLEITHTPKADIQKRIEELAQLVGLSDKLNARPSELSGGQKQRVAIARALATHPKVLLCDEATSALDPETTAAILKLLKTINHQLKLTVLLITHEMDVIKRICDRVAILEQGALVEEAEVFELFANPKSEAGKSLTQAALHVELPASLQKQLQPRQAKGLKPIVRLAFLDDSTDEPILTTLSKQHNVSTNILQANIDVVHGKSIGVTLCKLQGTDKNISAALKFLDTHNVKSEVLGYV
jgi:D-methionine transport system ATP-binding protein